MLRACDAPTPTDVREQTLFEWVPIEKMFVDGYGRPISKARVANLRKHWDPQAVGVILLSYRASTDRYAILDGHHRAQAARAEGLTLLPSRIYLDLTYEQEAALYVRFATVNQQTATDKFRARLAERDPNALQIKRIAEGQGLRLALASHASGQSVRMINAIGALESVYTHEGPEILAETLRLLDISFNGHGLAYSSIFLHGMAAFLRRYAETMEERRLTFVLGRVGADELAQRAKLIKKSGVGASGGGPIGRAILGAYNNGLKTRHLSDWVERLMPEVPADERSRRARLAQETIRARMGEEAYRKSIASRRWPERTEDSPGD